jgi:hypothetical protein
MEKPDILDGRGADVINLALRREPKALAEQFWQINGDVISQGIRDLPYLERLLDIQKKDYPDLDREGLIQILIDIERGFTAHVLQRLVEILTAPSAIDRLAKGELVFNLNTSMMYDIDGTLLGLLIADDDRGPTIRPAAPILLAFIKSHLPKIRLGLLTTRSADSLQRQLVDPEEAGSLTAIAEYFDPELIRTLFAVGGFIPTERNTDDFDMSIYSGFRPETRRYVLETEMGYSPEAVEVFEDKELPILLKAAQEKELLSHLCLWFSIELERFTERLFRLPGSPFEGTDLKAVQGDLTFEISKRSRELALAFDRDSEEEEVRVGLAAEVCSSLPETYTSEQKLFLQPAALEAVNAIWKYFSEDIESKVIEADMRDLVDSTTLQRMEYLSQNDYLEVIGRRGELSVVWYLNYSGRNSTTLSGRIWSYICKTLGHNGVSLEADFQQRLNAAIGKVEGHNHELRYSFPQEIASLLGITNWQHAENALQRLAKCRRELDDGDATIVIAIDNLEAAERFDQLFQGNLRGQDGEILDPFKLFNLPEEYRGRIWLIHVGKLAAFTRDAVRGRLEKVYQVA